MYCFWQKLYRDIILEPVDCLKVCVPSLVYVIQNNLLYIALSNLDAVTYQVSYCTCICCSLLCTDFFNIKY